STFRPASTCFSAVIICASVCLLFDINPPSPNTISYSVLCGFWRAGQKLMAKIEAVLPRDDQEQVVVEKNKWKAKYPTNMHYLYGNE
ncbi:MAG: hypothetical protein WCF30_15895, partial [Terracidiphilus sp.]